MRIEPQARPSLVGINYYILSAMFAATLLFAVANYYEPQIDRQADFFEVMYSLSQFVTGAFGLVVAKKYWGSKVFGPAYLALGIAFILEGIASSIYTVMAILGTPNPYPGPPDIFVVPYYFLVLYHVVRCTRHFKKKLSTRDKLIIIFLPVSVNVVYVIALLFPISIPGSVPDLLSKQITIGNTTFELVPVNHIPLTHQHLVVGKVIYALIPLNLTSTAYPQIPTTNSSIDLVPLAFSHLTIGAPIKHDQHFLPGFFAGLFYNIITTVILGWAIVAATVYRGTILGNAWGLLLVGIGLLSIADIIYDFTTIQYYDRTNPTMAIWIFGRMIICYALYIHRRNL